uniref:NADH-ubiquinone oxidoreductase chain 1 n=1 Tax=Lamellodiscus spari TaxID=330065 RepID=A0A346Q036_9PLAT|nr:NADH dehydrogenase subunit 1 [Lamellodiscus spari]
MLFFLLEGLIGILISFIFIMVFVAFFILSERKILGYIQLRKGPNKVGLAGLFQSFADLMKLIIKVKFYNFLGRSNTSLIGVFLIVLGAFLFSLIYYITVSGDGFSNSLLIFLIITSLGSYSILLVGWGSFNKYSLYGSLRASFSSLTFEACLMCIVIIFGLICNNYNIVIGNNDLHLFYCLFPLYTCFLIAIFCDTNRTPFDYSESESDLVSGFNTEYSNVYFTCLFACEYLIIYIMSWFLSVVFFSGAVVFISALIQSFVIIWVRGVLPRVRFDVFIFFMWGITILVLAIFIGVSF